jgi:hypothetical protein
MDKLKNWIRENNDKMDIDVPNATVWDRLKKNLSKHSDSDQLKKYIAEKQDELQIEIPHAQSWNKISSSVKTKKPRHVYGIKRTLVYLSAACIIAIISLGIFRYVNTDRIDHDVELAKTTSPKNNVSKNDTIEIEYSKDQLIVTPVVTKQSYKPTIKHKSPAVASKPAKKQIKKLLPPEVLQVQKDYDQLIAGQIAYTKSLAVYGENESYFQDFMYDFKLLEIEEQELRKSIAQNGLANNSIEELTTIYQQKLTVLKKLQNEISKTSNRNKNLTDTIPSYISL